ncbi:MAG: spore coat protein U domain-containing protein [Enterobacteriaceae bacterium]
MGSGGGSALTVTCTEDLASTLTLDGGQSGDAALRYMKNAGGTQRLPIGSIRMPPAITKSCLAARYLSLAQESRRFLFCPHSPRRPERQRADSRCV